MATKTINEIHSELNSLNIKLIETNKLLSNQTKLIGDSCVSYTESVHQHLLNKTLSKISLNSKDISIQFERDIVEIILLPTDYRTSYKLVIKYDKNFDTKAPCLAIRLPDKYFYIELADTIYTAYNMLGYILIDISTKQSLYKLVMSAYKYITEQIDIETGLHKLSDEQHYEIKKLEGQLNYTTFETKLQPLSIIITDKNARLLIHRITNETILVSSSNSIIDKHDIGEKYRINKATLYKNYTHRYDSLRWRILSKEEYVEEFI